MDFAENLAGKHKRKLTALPLLVVLFVLSYSLLTKLVVEQDKTIDSQRSLIHQLFKDNIYLNKLHKHIRDVSGKGKASSGSHLGSGNSSRTQSDEIASAQVPLIQVPLSQVPLTQVPSNKTRQQASAKAGRKTRKGDKTSAAKPVEPTDPSDMRRVLFSI